MNVMVFDWCDFN